MAYTFDGKGINGNDSYKSRLATLTKTGHEIKGLGNLLALAPDLLRNLQIMTDNAAWAAHIIGDIPEKSHYLECIKEARALIAMAKP